MSTTQIIGTITRYFGNEHPYLRDHDVRIVAVLHNGNTEPDEGGDIPGYQHLTTDDEITRAGGVTAADRVEVAPFLAAEGRFSWATSDPRADDLTAFASLRGND